MIFLDPGKILGAQETSPEPPLTAFISYDEKPGIQAIGPTVDDLLPVLGQYPMVGRDYEYRRHGTLILMVGLDLVTEHVHSTLVERHRSREFIAFLK